MCSDTWSESGCSAAVYEAMTQDASGSHHHILCSNVIKHVCIIVFQGDSAEYVLF